MLCCTIWLQALMFLPPSPASWDCGQVPSYSWTLGILSYLRRSFGQVGFSLVCLVFFFNHAPPPPKCYYLTFLVHKCSLGCILPGKNCSQVQNILLHITEIHWLWREWMLVLNDWSGRRSKQTDQDKGFPLHPPPYTCSLLFLIALPSTSGLCTPDSTS